MLRTLEGTLNPEGTVRFREAVQLTRPQRVLVTLLEDDAAWPASEPGSVDQLLALLATPSFSERPYGLAEALEATVESNRSAWDA
jgi:hypothetical protein